MWKEDSVFQADSSDQSPNLLIIFWAAEFRVLGLNAEKESQHCPVSRSGWFSDSAAPRAWLTISDR
jgi:hypothetical protein